MQEQEQPSSITVEGYVVNKSTPIGIGGFGVVYEAFKEGKKYAAKAMNFKQHPKIASKECVQLLKLSVDHSNVIKIHKVKKHIDYIWLFMDFCEQGDLKRYFHVQRPTFKIKLHIMHQIAEAVEYLHIQNIVHRDIKPENILVKAIIDMIPDVKLSDLGLAKYLDEDRERSAMSTDLGTKAYKAPEFWNAKDQNGKLCYHRDIDVFACGLTFLGMLQFDSQSTLHPYIEDSVKSSENSKPIGQVLHDRKEYNQPSISVVNIDSKRDCKHVLSVKAMIMQMIDIDPKERPKAADVAKAVEVILKVSMWYVKAT